MKILFYATYPNIATGYSRIGNILTNYLAEKGHDVYYFGISNFKTNTVDRYIHPNIKLIDALEEEKKLNSNELYGVNTICDFVLKINPDIVFLYNDLIVISRIFNNFHDVGIVKNFKIITYLDLVYPYEKIRLINHINSYSDAILVFSDYWKNNLISMGIDENKIGILYHGFDDENFFEIENSDAKKYFNFEPDDFLILNTNRNSYRKAIDKTIDAFIKFLRLKNMNPKIKLFLNMDIQKNENSSMVSSSCDVLNYIKISCLENNLDFQHVLNKYIFVGQKDKLTDQELNKLYNACDIGLNTCLGEGFGLCNLEHAGVGKPQIISNVGGLSDIFKSDYSFPINPTEKIYVGNELDYHGGYLELCPVSEFVNGLDTYYNNRVLANEHGNKSMEIIRKKYNWKKILDELDEFIIGL